MRLDSDLVSDKGVFSVHLVKGERLIVLSQFGEIIIDCRNEDLNVFKVSDNKRVSIFNSKEEKGITDKVLI